MEIFLILLGFWAMACCGQSTQNQLDRYVESKKAQREFGLPFDAEWERGWREWAKDNGVELPGS